MGYLLLWNVCIVWLDRGCDSVLPIPASAHHLHTISTPSAHHSLNHTLNAIHHSYRGIAVLNGAGRFDDTTAATPPATTSINAASNAENKLESATPLGNATLGNEPGSLVRQWLTSAVDSVSSALKRVVLYVTFMQTKQPSRIMSVLKSVYVSPQNLDDALVASIVDPAQHPDAPEVFAKVITGNGKSVNELLRALPEGTPVLLLWYVGLTCVIVAGTCVVVCCCCAMDLLGFSQVAHQGFLCGQSCTT